LAVLLLLLPVLAAVSACAPAEEKDYAESFARGEQAIAAEDYETAVQELTEAMDSQDEEAMVWVRRGDAYWELELYEDAVSDYEHALALDATLFEVYDRLAECYRRLGDPQVGEETLARREEALRDNAD
jgi:tetratricopeptide (TPR) repeat protein